MIMAVLTLDKRRQGLECVCHDWVLIVIQIRSLWGRKFKEFRANKREIFVAGDNGKAYDIAVSSRAN